MRNSSANLILTLIVLLVLAAGCKTTEKVSLQNLAHLYQVEKQFTEQNSRVYHTTDTTSTLFVEVLFSKLVYQKDPYSGMYTCAYRLGYKLTQGYESKEILESSSLLSGDSLNYGKNTGVVQSFDIKMKYPGKYLLEITLFDINRQAGSTWYLEADKTSKMGRQDFLVLDRNNSLIFKDNIPEGEQFKIISDQPDLKYLYVSHYQRDFPVARPPYTEDRDQVFVYKPDSAYIIQLVNGETDWMVLDKPGFYHFRKDSVNRTGLTLYNFPAGFPEIITAGQLRDPLRYITSRKEYDTLMEAVDVKAAVDAFWLKSARTPERARNLIQKYYSNVEEANRYFTSYLEGWKTDRGLIYIIFGKPTYVYRSKETEEWIYGEPQNRSSLRFTFVQVNNPFTDNDYMLLRSPTFKEPWFITVQSWRR
jgi:GWxTD domain-containing protein